MSVGTSRLNPCAHLRETSEARGIMGRLRKAAETKRKSGLQKFEIYYFNEKKSSDLYRKVVKFCLKMQRPSTILK